MINRVFLCGRLGKEAEIRYFENGSAVARFSIATNEVYVSQSGSKVEKTFWHKIIAFGKIAEYCKKFSQGHKVFLEGSIQYREWTPENGDRKLITEIRALRIHSLDPIKKDENGGENFQSTSQESDSQPSNQNIEIDTIPF